MSHSLHTFATAMVLFLLCSIGFGQTRIIIDGTDANEHGSVSGGVNQSGWRYMQKALETLAPQIANGKKVLVDLGTDTGTLARNAITSAFNLSNLPAAGWTIVHINATTDIASFLDGGSVSGATLGNTGILYLSTAGGESIGDITVDELAVINSHAAVVANLINNLGAGLFAMSESKAGATGWGWLTTLINTVTPVAAQATGLTMTADGQAAFSGLTNADLSTGPWHNYFTGNFGSLKVLAVDASNRAVILGGVAVVEATFQFSAPTYSVSEGGATASVTVTRIGITNKTQSVEYYVSGGTATQGADYTLANGTLTFVSGDTQKTISFPIVDDALYETNETAVLSLRNPSAGAATAAPSTATLTILENDPPPSISIDNVTVTEGLSGTTNATFTVRLSAVSALAATVDFATANGSAVVPGDYIAQSGTVTFNPGDTTKQIIVVVNGDTVIEPTETFTVNLSNPINATLANTQGVGTIVNGAADLKIDSLTVQPVPTFFGQTVNVTWVVKNLGNAATTATWNERLFLSATQSPVAGDLVLLTRSAADVVPLGPGNSYTRTQSVSLPFGATLTPGDYYLVAVTDADNAQFESDESNNTFASNRITLNFPPDLQITDIQPTGAIAAADIVIRWKDRNTGFGAAIGTWGDRVVVKNETANKVILDTTLPYDASGIGQIAPNSSIDRQVPFHIPDNADGIGQLSIAITTDASNTVFENNQSGTAEANNSAQATIEATLDLQVAGLTVEPATQLQSGNTVIIRWNDTNTGALSTIGSWNDRVVVVNTTTATTLLDTLVFYDATSNGAIGSGQSRARQYSFRLPDGPAGVGNLQITVNGDASNNLFEYNTAGTAETNNGSIIGRTSTLAPYPDLVVSSIVAPVSAWTDSAFDVTWRTTNQGTAPATGAWVDRVYLSVDQQLGSDVLLGTFPYNVGLAVGQNATRTQSVAIPPAGIANGNYHIIVMTDADNNVVEGVNEGNNATVAVQPIAVSVSPIPDLIVQTVEVPATANSGQTIRVQWTVKNLGPGATNASQWHDQVFLSPDQTPDGSDDWMVEVLNASYLNTAESYISAVDVKVPIGFSGNYYVIVKADSRNEVLESTDANNTALHAIPIQLTPPPDLRVPSVTAPQNGFSGQNLFVSWTVLNDGSGPVPPDQPTWSDAVYLSATSTLNTNTATLLGAFSHDGALAQNASYTRQNQTVSLPPGISGTYYIFVLTDRGNQVYEHVNENNNSARTTAPIQVTLTPPPDLIVPTVSAGASGTAGLPISVSWTTRNQGAGGTVPGGWNEKVYLSASATLNTATATLLGTFTNGSSLEGGLSYNKTVNVTLPNCISGPFYVFVVTDTDESVFEYDPGYDANANNSGRTASPVQVALTPPDLQITAVTPPASGVAGQFITVGWTVRNAGISETQVSTWRDRVYLSASGTFDAASAITLGTFQHNGSLPVNATYTQSQRFQIPVTAAGNYYVFVETDSAGEVVECSAEDNNRFRSAGVVNVASNAPDLVVSTVGIPGTAESGRPITVTWTIANQGSGATPSTSWRDTVYLSASDVLDTATAVVLGSKIHSGAVATGGNYADSATFQLPNGITGQHYLFVVTDTDNAAFESREDNNSGRAAAAVTAAVNITLSPSPDLRISSVAAPATGFTGQGITVSWTTTNAGNGATDVSQWTDYVYLSRDQILDPTDPSVGYTAHSGILLASGNYSASAAVSIPNGFSGPYFVFVTADRNNALYESDEANNSAYTSTAVQVSIPPPADLVVTNIEIPATGSPGQPATIRWTVTNAGANPATGTWTDSIYLSADGTWDINDALVGRFDHSASLVASGAYTQTSNVPLPGVVPGNYRVIVRSDIRNNVRESDEDNNSDVSAGVVAIELVQLQLGVPRSALIAAGGQHFYKVIAPAGQTMLLTLNTNTSSSGNLFTRLGQVPNRVRFDSVSEGEPSSQQVCVVPSTEVGTYYVLIDATLADIQGSYTIIATLEAFGLRALNPNRVGNGGEVTLAINGARFSSEDTAFDVEDSGGNVLLRADKVDAELPFRNVHVIDSATAFVTLDVQGLAPGNYFVKARSSGVSSNALPLTVTEGTGELVMNVTGPSSARPGQAFQVFIDYANTGSTDLLPPVIHVTSRSGNSVKVIGTERELTSNSDLVLLGFASQGLTGRLAPGASGRIALNLSASTPKADIEVKASVPSEKPFEWDGFISAVEQSGNAEQASILNRVRGRMGETEAEVVRTISDRASTAASGTGSPSMAEWVSNEAFLTTAESTAALLADTTRNYKTFDAETDVSIIRYNPIDPLDRSDRVGGTTGETTFSAFRDGKPTLLIVHGFRNDVNDPSGQWAWDRAQYFEQRYPGQFNIVISDHAVAMNAAIINPRGAASKINAVGDQVAELLTGAGISGDSLNMDGHSHGYYISVRAAEKLGGIHILTGLSPASSAGIGADIRRNARGVADSVRVFTGLSIFDSWLTLDADYHLFLAHADPDPFAVHGLSIERTNECLRDGGACLEFIDPNATDLPVSGGRPFNFNAVLNSDGSLFEPFEEMDQFTTELADGLVFLARLRGREGRLLREAGLEVPTVNPVDPNDIIGPAGYGPEKWVSTARSLPYTIRFENMSSATATAQVVRITQQLDLHLDPRSFRIGDFGFGDLLVHVPDNRSFYSTRLDLTATKGVFVDVTAGINIASGEAFWNLVAVDPETGELPIGAQAGFLPPNINGTEGQGFVNYTIRPRSTAVTGDQVTALATIIFDTQEPISTEPVLNALDAVSPITAVSALAAVQESTEWIISWDGADDLNASGLKNFDVYVSDNGGEWTQWQAGVTFTSAPFTGLRSHAYRFYTVGRDNTGNVETAPATPDAATVVSSGPNTPPTITPIANRIGVVGQLLQFQVVATDTDVPANTLSFALEAGVPAGAAIDPATGLFTWTPAAGQAGLAYPITVRVTDNGTPVLDATRGFAITVRTNQAPVAGADFLGTDQNRPVSVAARKLLLNDSDSDGDSLTLTLAGTTSIQGGSLSLTNGSVTYSPLAAFSGTDTFTYTVSDGFGGSAQGAVTVTVQSAFAPVANPVRVTPLPNGHMALRMVGIPGRTYVVQASENLVDWAPLVTMVAGPNGVFEFEDTDVVNFSSRYYRLALP